jgi:hypothetical protein
MMQSIGKTAITKGTHMRPFIGINICNIMKLSRRYFTSREKYGEKREEDIV